MVQIGLTTQHLFFIGHVLKFVDLVKFIIAVTMVIAYQCKLPVNIQQHLVKRDISTITRLKNHFVMCYVTTTTTAMTLSVYGISLWNSLYTELTNIKTVIKIIQTQV